MPADREAREMFRRLDRRVAALRATTPVTVPPGPHTHDEYLTQLEADVRYALAGINPIHNHPVGPNPVSVAKVTADQAFTTTSLANVTGLSFTVGALSQHSFEAVLAITSAATATGWQFGFTGPASPALFVAAHEYQSSATAWTTSTLNAVTYGAFTLVTSAYVANAPILVRIKGIVATGAASGTVQLQFRSEVAGSAVTVKRGSTLTVA